MKLILIGDTHYGVRNDRPEFLDSMARFLGDVFFPYLWKNTSDVAAVVHLGDLVDRRKYVNINTANRLRRDFVLPLEEWCHAADKEAYFIAGNHDVYYRNTNRLNALDELLPNAWTVRDDALRISAGGVGVLLVPWICDENVHRVWSRVIESDARVALGHFELKGHEQYKNQFATHGDDPAMLSKFDLVCSGHYHHRSTQGNVTYIGAAGQYTWNDHGGERGFAVLETSNMTLEFIENPYAMFERIEHAGTWSHVTGTCRNKFVKLVVRAEDDELEGHVAAIEADGPAELQVIHAVDTSVAEGIDAAAIVDDTLEAFHAVIDEIDGIDARRDRLKALVSEVHAEATQRV